MIVVLCISVFLLASAIYVLIDAKHTNKLPDEEYHFVIGKISDIYNSTDKHITIEFMDGNNITLGGEAIGDVVADLDNNTNYTFYWRWSRFENGPEHIAKKCYQINDGKNIVWQCGTPITAELIAGFVILWITVGLVLFVGITCNRKINERKK